MAKKTINTEGSILITGLLVESGRVGKSLNRLDLESISPDSIFNHIPVMNCCGGKDVLGEAKIYVTKKGLIADYNIVSNYRTLYPAVSGVIEEHHTDEFGVKVIDKFRITEVSLCNINNDDDSIKTVEEQLNEE